MAEQMEVRVPVFTPRWPTFVTFKTIVSATLIQLYGQMVTISPVAEPGTFVQHLIISNPRPFGAT